MLTTKVQRNKSLLTDWSETGSYCGEARLLLAIGSQRPQLTSLFSLATNTLRTFPCNLMKIFLLPNRKRRDNSFTPSQWGYLGAESLSKVASLSKRFKKTTLNVQTYFTQSSAPLPLLRFSSGFIYTSNQKNPIHRKCLWLSSSPQTWGSLFISTNILELQSAGFAHECVRARACLCVHAPEVYI